MVVLNGSLLETLVLYNVNDDFRSFSLILMAGGTRILYDLVPCISFRGWPQIAAAWLQETGRFWQRAGLPHSEAAGAFHLLPGRGRHGSDWR